MAKRQPTETFFILTSSVRDKLLESKLTAAEWRIWCYLVSLDPFGDRGAKFSPAELMLKCGIKKTTYFTAKAKFQQLGLFDFQDSVTKVFNLQGYSVTSDYSQQEKLIESENSEYQSENSESQFENSEYQSENSESETLKPLSNKHLASPKTKKTFQTPQTGREENIFSSEQMNCQKEKSNCSQDTNQQGTNLSSITQINDVVSNLEINQKATTTNSEEDKTSPVRSIGKVKKSTPSKNQSDNLTPEITTRLEALNIPLDKAVRAAIATYHLSQIKGALAHIEETSDEIRSSKGVFLYQVPRQEVDKRKDPKEHITPEFQEWYTKAIADGVVINRPIESLGLYQFREPIVELPDGGQHPWTRVRDGKAEVDSEEVKKEMVEKMAAFKEKLQKNAAAHNNSKYLSSQEKAKRQLKQTSSPSKDSNLSEPLPPELETQLKEMGIPLNAVVRNEIATHPLDQIEAILTIVKEKLKAIGESGVLNAKKVFIYHLMTT